MKPEQPSHFPAVPVHYPRTEFVPSPEPSPSVSAGPPVDAGPQLSAEPGAPSPTGETAPTASPSPNRREKHPAVTLAGRVAAAPTFRTTPKTNDLIASFPLASHTTEEGEVVTTYYQVVAFGRVAQTVQEKLTLGQHVEVIGYKHEGTTKAGKPKVEYYAAVIRRPKGASAASAE